MLVALFDCISRDCMPCCWPVFALAHWKQLHESLSSDPHLDHPTHHTATSPQNNVINHNHPHPPRPHRINHRNPQQYQSAKNTVSPSTMPKPSKARAQGLPVKGSLSPSPRHVVPNHALLLPAFQATGHFQPTAGLSRVVMRSSRVEFFDDFAPVIDLVPQIVHRGGCHDG